MDESRRVVTDYPSGTRREVVWKPRGHLSPLWPSFELPVEELPNGLIAIKEVGSSSGRVWAASSAAVTAIVGVYATVAWMQTGLLVVPWVLPAMLAVFFVYSVRLAIRRRDIEVDLEHGTVVERHSTWPLRRLRTVRATLELSLHPARLSHAGGLKRAWLGYALVLHYGSGYCALAADRSDETLLTYAGRLPLRLADLLGHDSRLILARY